MIKLKKREKLALLKQIVAKYEQSLLVSINDERIPYNVGWYNAMTHVISEIKSAGILDD